MERTVLSANEVVNDTPTERVWRTCRHCSHKWLGKPHATMCSKCKKYIGRVKLKDIKDTPIGDEIKMENVYSSIKSMPPLPEEIEKREKGTGEKVQADIPADTYASLVAFPFDLIATQSKKEYWKLTAKEKETLAPLLKAVGDKWMTEWFDKYPNEGALAIAFGMVLMGKFAIEISQRKSEKKDKEKTYKEFKDKRTQQTTGTGGGVNENG